MRTFINHTNHAAKCWSRSQRAAAERYGEIVDVPFPAIPASAETTEVTELALQTGRELLRMEPAAVLCQGEYTYTYALTMFLQAHGIPVLTACSERIVSESVNADGSTSRQSIFQFVMFRTYPRWEQVNEKGSTVS